ncbi:MAG: hypothetical protein MUP98_20590 [Candidatus Aminicenantes bacterium]|nr:hypothetical protein [Candidatus Aminicenantes bacterium]
MKRQKTIQIIASFFLIFAIFLFTEIKAESFPGGKDRIIEVCSEGVVYVPPGTKIVKCMGIIKKVIRVIPYQENLRLDESCICPHCCGGECGVIISCDAEPGKYSDFDSNKEGTLCVMLLDCD